MLTYQEVQTLIKELTFAEKGTSDLLILSDYPFQVLAYGKVKKVNLPSFPVERLSPYQVEQVAFVMMREFPHLYSKLVRDGYADFSFALDDGTRFRVNVFSRQRTYNIVMRLLGKKIKTIEELKLPPVLHQVAKEKFGLVFVTGATGQGKTTTLAAILQEINQTQPVHILTLEDPIEFVYEPAQAVINQRELGTDFSTFAEGLRAALREAPHVILVGEIRDRETMDIALSAAETGHLVFSTLHTIGAGQTINRIIGFYSKEEEGQIRQRLASAVRWVIGQKLLPRVDGGRVAILDILYNTLRTREIILSGEAEGKTFYDVMTQGGPLGMQTFDQHIIELFKEGLIDEETAYYHSTRKSVVGRQIELIKKERGHEESSITLEIAGKGVR